MVDGPDGSSLPVRATQRGDLRAQVAPLLVAAGLSLVRLDRGAQRLESIFLKLTHGKERSQ